jgi:hypothetical protein
MKAKRKSIDKITAAYRFVSKDASHPNLAEPWVSDGSLVATNGHVMIICQIDRPELDGKAILKDWRPVQPKGVPPPHKRVIPSSASMEAIADWAFIGRLPKHAHIATGVAIMDPRDGTVRLMRGPGEGGGKRLWDVHYLALVADTISDMGIRPTRVAVSGYVLFIEADDASFVVMGVRQ